MADDQPRRLTLVTALPAEEATEQAAGGPAEETAEESPTLEADVDDPDLTRLLEINPLPGGVTLRRALSDLHVVREDD